MPLTHPATMYTQVGKPYPNKTLQPTDQNLTLALLKRKSFPLREFLPCTHKSLLTQFTVYRIAKRNLKDWFCYVKPVPLLAKERDVC